MELFSYDHIGYNHFTKSIFTTWKVKKVIYYMGTLPIAGFRITNKRNMFAIW